MCVANIKMLPTQISAKPSPFITYSIDQELIRININQCLITCVNSTVKYS